MQSTFLFILLIVRTLNSGNSATGMFYDLTKTFDQIDHSILLKKLNNIGIRAVGSSWFGSFLLGRTQLVEISFTS